MRNALSPINKLPPEILAHVCTLTPQYTSDFAHLCAQVCRSWRTTLLAFPSLWNEIRAEVPLDVEVYLARSGGAPINVYVYGASPAGRLLRKVVPHLGRVRVLSLSLLTGDEKVLDWFGGPGMTSLRDLLFEKASTNLRLSASMMEKLSSLGTNATKLFLRNIDTHMSSLSFPRLRHFSLDIGHGFKEPRVSDMIGFLRGHPLLEKLWLNHVNCSYPDGAGAHIESVPLQHLKDVKLGGRPSSRSPDYLPYIEVDLLPYLRLPLTGQCSIGINQANVAFPSGTNYLLTLIRALEITSGPGGCLGGGSGFTHAGIAIKESPSALTGQWALWTPEKGDLWVDPEGVVVDSQSWLIPDWETTIVDEGSGAGEAGDDEIQAQLSRLGCYLDPLRWSPSPLAIVEILVLSGFGYTRNKGKYLQYLRECFMGLNRVRGLQVDETNFGMAVHLLQPFEGDSGGMVLLFPLLRVLIFCKCAPMEVPWCRFLEVMKKRATLGNVLEKVRVDGERVDLSELSAVQQTT